MSFIYKKEIIDGVSSQRKLLGIPIYIRNDTPGAIIRKYLLGMWKTITYPQGKRYYLFGIRVKKNGITYDLPINSVPDAPKNIHNTANAKNTAKAPAETQDKNKQELKKAANPMNNVNVMLEIQKLNKQMTEITSTVNLLKDKLNLCYYETANFKNLIQCQHLHQKTFGPYKNAFKGKDVVLVATGPTAKYYNPIKNAIYVGVNNACLLENIELDYLFCQDFYMGEEKINKIVNYRRGKCQKFFGRIPDNRIEACHKSKEAQHVRRCPKYLVEEAEASEYYVYDNLQNRIAYDIELEPLSASGVAFSAFQFILHAHPKRIYLVGCDCSSGFFYSSDIVFNNSYMVTFWKKFKAYVDELYPDVEVISINPVGLKNVFKDQYDETYLIKNR